MIRQAHTYLVGALSGATLIGIAIGVFVLLVSAQVFHEWPIADLGSHDQNRAVAPAKAFPSADHSVAAGAAGTTAGAARRGAGKARVGATKKHAAHHHATSADPGAVGDATTPVSAGETSQSSSGGDGTSSGGNSGSHSSQPSSSAQSSPSNTNTGSGSGGSGATAAGSSGSSGSTGGTGTGTGTVTAPVTAATKPTQVVTEAVNETVHGVDEKVLGGTLESTGVTEVTENLVTGVVGPESVVGKTVEGVGEVVGGLLGGGGH